MKKILFIMLLLAFAGRTWAADYVKIGGHEIANGDTHANFNNSRIDSGSASLSSDGKTLTLDNNPAQTARSFIQQNPLRRLFS